MTSSRPDSTRDRSARWLCALGAICLAIPVPGVAQERTDEDPKPPAAKYILRTPDGAEIPLSDLNVSDQDIEDLIRQRKKAEPKQYVVRKLDIEGRVDGAMAFLKATWTVHLNEDVQWVSVPIGLNEGKATDVATHQHANEGRAQQDTSASTRSGTRHWFFKGKGDHTLTLPLVVSVRELQHLRHSMRFRIPEGISVTKLSLKVPHRSIMVEPPRGSGMSTERSPSGTTVNVWGLTSQFSLQWDIRPNIVDARPFLRSRTNLTVNLSTDPFGLSARQTLTMQQGSQQVFDIVIPEGFTVTKREPQHVDPTGRVNKLDFEPDGRSVRLELSQPLTEPLELNWALAATDPTLLRRWSFMGIRVRDAQEQTTDLELIPREGVAVREIKSSGVQRQLAAARSASRVTRARFVNPDSRLVVELATVEPFFAVTPQMALLLTNGQLRLEARFRVRVLRGSVSEMNLRWPGFKAEGWELMRLSEELTLPAPLGAGLIQWTQGEFSDDESVSLRLATPQSDSFEFAVLADRKIGGKVDFPVSLPTIDARIRQGASLTVATEPTTELTLAVAAGTATDRLPNDAVLAEWLTSLVDRLSVSNYAIRSEQRVFNAVMTTRERSVTVPQNTVTLELMNKSVDVEQTLRYRVEFGHATEVRLRIPPGIEPTVSVNGSTLTELSVAQDSRTYRLPEPTTGEFEIDVAYRHPYSLKDQTIVLPIVRSEDADAGETRVGIRPDAYYRVQLTDKNWLPGFSRDLDAVWTATEPPAELVFAASSPLGAMARRFTVSRALVQTRLAGDVSESRINFVLRGRFEKQVLSVPANTTISSVAWNDETLSPDRWGVDRLIGTRVLTVDQRQISGTGVLTVDFRSTVAAPGWSRRASLECVTLPEDVPIDEVLWQVILPTGEHLASFDMGNTPCFRWAFGSWGWTRQPMASFADLGEWLSRGNNRQPHVVRTVAGNAYTFQQPGLVPLRFATLDQSVVLFLGAAVAFATAFAMIRFSPRRFAIALPVVLMVLSMLSLWFAPALQLLAQPAVGGIVLASVAQVIDRRRRKRGYSPYRAESHVRAASSREPHPSNPSSLSGSIP